MRNGMYVQRVLRDITQMFRVQGYALYFPLQLDEHTLNVRVVYDVGIRVWLAGEPYTIRQYDETLRQEDTWALRSARAETGKTWYTLSIPPRASWYAAWDFSGFENVLLPTDLSYGEYRYPWSFEWSLRFPLRLYVERPRAEWCWVVQRKTQNILRKSSLYVPPTSLSAGGGFLNYQGLSVVNSVQAKHK